jgi:hypothetical protein
MTYLTTLFLQLVYPVEGTRIRSRAKGVIFFKYVVLVRFQFLPHYLRREIMDYNKMFQPYVQVTVQRDKRHIKQPIRCIKYPKLYFVVKLYMFRASSLPIIRSYLLYTRQLIRFMQVMWPLPSRVRLELSSNPTLLSTLILYLWAVLVWQW